MKLGLKFVYFLNIIAAVCSLMAYLSPFIHPKITGLFSYFGLGFPMMIFSHFVFLIFWLIVKPKYSLLSIFILVLGYYPLMRTIGLNPAIKNDVGLNILSYNIGYSRFYFGGKNSKVKIKEFKEFIKEENPGVICLQERAKWQLNIYKDIFKSYKLYSKKGIGTAVYSKWPVVNSGNIGFDTKAHNATWIDVKYKSDTLRVYSVHLSSNKVKNLTDNIKEIWDESIFILDKYNEHAVIRAQQMDLILKHANNSPHPVVITGDFNDIPQSFIYSMIAEDYCDAFIEKGSGLGKTYMTRLPGLRIDYAFVSEELCVNEHRILKTNLSDHYPIMTRVVVK